MIIKCDFQYLHNTKMKTITIFTPTFNRGYILMSLFNSLQNQTNLDFEWVIVDDGSVDNTKEIVEDFKKISRFPIRYFYQNNAGKHIAINKGVQEANGKLFFIVDSDDYLSVTAVAQIVFDFSFIIDDETFAGLTYLRAYHNGVIIGGDVNYSVLDCNLLDYRFKYKIKGDKAEIYRTDVMKKFIFPRFEGEKFCPEALVFNRMALQYKLRHINEAIYFCEYLADGLTAKIVKVRMQSFQASLLYYQELYEMPIPYIYKVKAAINYCRFALCASTHKYSYFSKLPLGMRLIACPVGILMHIRDLIVFR